MTTRWRNLVLTAFVTCGAFLIPTGLRAQDDDAPKKKKAAPKEEKTASPIIRPQKKGTSPAPKPREEIGVRRDDPTNLDEAWRAIDYQLSFGTTDEARRLMALMMQRPDFSPAALGDLREQYG